MVESRQLLTNQGENAFSHAASNALESLDNPSMPAQLGSFELDGREVRFTAAPGATVGENGSR